MKPIYQRLIIALDEWLGMLLLVYLHSHDRGLFWVVLPIWIVAVYLISYPLYGCGVEEHGAIVTLRERWRRRRG